MRALNVRQPWAGEIARGEKLIEYRNWHTDYRGDLLIVASKRSWCDGTPDDQLGVAVCLVTLVDCMPNTDPQEPGSWEWRLENPRPVKPVPITGQLGLYNVEDKLVKPL